MIDPLFDRLGYTDARPVPFQAKNQAQKALDRVVRAACPAGRLHFIPVKGVSHGKIHGEGLTLGNFLWAAVVMQAESTFSILQENNDIFISHRVGDPRNLSCQDADGGKTIWPGKVDHDFMQPVTFSFGTLSALLN